MDGLGRTDPRPTGVRIIGPDVSTFSPDPNFPPSPSIRPPFHSKCAGVSGQQHMQIRFELLLNTQNKHIQRCTSFPQPPKLPSPHPHLSPILSHSPNPSLHRPQPPSRSSSSSLSLSLTLALSLLLAHSESLTHTGRAKSNGWRVAGRCRSWAARDLR